jgi:hypothetical protein
MLIVWKQLLFTVISCMLLLSAGDCLSHTHNSIVNKHRHNVLMNFEALTAAAKGGPAKDIVLTDAVACIVAPQEPGYAKSSSSQECSPTQAMAWLARNEDRRKRLAATQQSPHNAR